MPGYKLKLSDNIARSDSLLCPYCGFILKDAIQTEQGIRLCLSCYDDIQRNPKVLESVEEYELKANEPFHPDKAIRREVDKVSVKCANHEFGCLWTGTLLKHEDEHKHVCQCCKSMDCPYGCGEIVLREKLDVHVCSLSDVQCQYCFTTIKVRESHDHIISCPQAPPPSISDYGQFQEVVIAEFSEDPAGLRREHQELVVATNKFFKSEKLPQPVEVCEKNDCQFYSSGYAHVEKLERKVAETERQLAVLKVYISELELQLQASLASTYNGSFLWRIPDIRRRRRDALEGKTISLCSPPFYTGRNGYKMCMRAYLNGDGTGFETHISIFFVIMKGEYDPLLKWPFDHKVSLILVDQDHRRHIVQTFKPSPSSSSFQWPKSHMNIASGCPIFAKFKVLDNESYVKEDVMYIKCIVDTQRIYHP